VEGGGRRGFLAQNPSPFLYFLKSPPPLYTFAIKTPLFAIFPKQTPHHINLITNKTLTLLN
jgi:hypothetical protein